MNFISELKRRNVIRMAGLYLVGAWLITQVPSTVLPAFDAPAWSVRAVIIAPAIGLFPDMIFAWVRKQGQRVRITAQLIKAGTSEGRGKRSKTVVPGLGHRDSRHCLRHGCALPGCRQRWACASNRASSPLPKTLAWFACGKNAATLTAASE